MVVKSADSLAEELLEALGEQGYRSTSPRKAIAEAIAKLPHHFTAEELRQQLPRVGRATIYRSLKLLVDSGVICRVLLEDGNLHYQLSRRGHHHHLLCVHCGASQDLVGCDILDQLRDVSVAHGFELSGHWLEVYGRCKICVSADAIS